MVDKKKGKGKKSTSDDTQGCEVKAIWDEQNHATWLAIYMEEIMDGNKKATTLATKGSANLMRKFEERTRLRDTLAQFKNHWDSIRETGPSFDGETVVQDDKWWKLFSKIHNLNL